MTYNARKAPITPMSCSTADCEDPPTCRVLVDGVQGNFGSFCERHGNELMADLDAADQLEARQSSSLSGVAQP
jgi:hypothetical protein